MYLSQQKQQKSDARLSSPIEIVSSIEVVSEPFGCISALMLLFGLRLGFVQFINRQEETPT